MSPSWWTSSLKVSRKFVTRISALALQNLTGSPYDKWAIPSLSLEGRVMFSWTVWGHLGTFSTSHHSEVSRGISTPVKQALTVYIASIKCHTFYSAFISGLFLPCANPPILCSISRCPVSAHFTHSKDVTHWFTFAYVLVRKFLLKNVISPAIVVKNTSLISCSMGSP